MRYLGVEHRHKEKEYGIKSRAAYKTVMREEYEKFSKKYGNPLDDGTFDAEIDQEFIEVI